jgi:effector-binding domain-containing protein
LISEIAVVEVPARAALVLAATTTMEDLGDVLSRLFPELCVQAAELGLTPMGAPFTRYGATHADGAIEIEACLTVGGSGGRDCVVLDACRAVMVSHFGDYSTLGDAHFALGEFVRRERLETAGLCWEEYATDPGAEPDPAKWETRVYWPVK